MFECPICGLIFKDKRGHMRRHNSIFIPWNKGLTKEQDSRVKGGNKKGINIGHLNYYSREYLGNEKFNQIEENRCKKISQNANIEACKKGALKAQEIRRQKLNYGFTEEGLRKQSETMSKNRKNGVCRTWNKNLTKYEDERIMKYSLNKTIYFDKPERQKFTKEIRLAIRERDGFQCQECGNCNNLVIHHIDKNQVNNNLNNLKLLCRNCHARLHLNLQYAMVEV